MTPPWIWRKQGCNIIFSDSYGHQSYMLEAAEDYPDVTFVSCTGDHGRRLRPGQLQEHLPLHL